MSYNIDSCKIKKIENLTFPLAALYQHERKDWHPDRPILLDEDQMKVSISCGCEQKIIGTLKEEALTVTNLDLAGEGSGTLLDWIILPALRQSTGKIEAVLVWEGGDSITRLTVDNGSVNIEPIEL